MKLFRYALALTAAAQLRAAPVDFVRDVRPIFEKHCAECHGAEKQKSGYRLDVRDIALRGGDSGEAAIVPHDAKKSALIRHVSGEDEDMLMPPKKSGKARLTAEQIAMLSAWIDGLFNYARGGSEICPENPITSRLDSQLFHFGLDADSKFESVRIKVADWLKLEREVQALDTSAGQKGLALILRRLRMKSQQLSIDLPLSLRYVRRSK